MLRNKNGKNFRVAQGNCAKKEFANAVTIAAAVVVVVVVAPVGCC